MQKFQVHQNDSQKQVQGNPAFSQGLVRGGRAIIRLSTKPARARFSRRRAAEHFCYRIEPFSAKPRLIL